MNKPNCSGIVLMMVDGVLYVSTPSMFADSPTWMSTQDPETMRLQTEHQLKNPDQVVQISVADNKVIGLKEYNGADKNPRTKEVQKCVIAGIEFIESTPIANSEIVDPVAFQKVKPVLHQAGYAFSNVASNPKNPYAEEWGASGILFSLVAKERFVGPEDRSLFVPPKANPIEPK
jgi:hypothetical protein